MASVRKSIVYLSLCVGYALAGSRIFQPRISDQPTVEKRYFHVNPNADVRGYEATSWPDKTIRVCYKDPATREKFHRDLMAAHQVWVRAGLGDDFKIVAAPEADCNDHEKLKDCLLVSTGSDLATTPGFPTKDSFRRTSGDRGPEMRLADDESIGMLNKISNYAHELGHSIGLYHEHQNPNFWDGAGIKNAQGGTVFGPANNDNWRCQNLKDFASAVTGLVVQNPRGQQTIDRSGMCKDWSWAVQARFSAGDYLPMPESLGFAQPGKNGGDVDWKSIMICKFFLALIAVTKKKN